MIDATVTLATAQIQTRPVRRRPGNAVNPSKPSPITWASTRGGMPRLAPKPAIVVPAETALGCSLISSSNAIPNHTHAAIMATTPVTLKSQNVGPGEPLVADADRLALRGEVMPPRLSTATVILIR